MLLLRLLLGLVLGYLVLVFLAWLFQERIAFPSPRTPLPDPKKVGIPEGERIELIMKDGTKLVGWYLPARDAPAPALLWFYGNGETIGSIWPILRDFRPTGAALLAVDYPGYGASEGRATEAGLYEAADLAYAAVAARPGVDRIFVYGRSLGSAVATHTAARHPVAGLILESPFTTAAEMSRRHYGILPRFILRLDLDNLRRMGEIRCPVLVFHGTADRLVPTMMGQQLAAAAPGPVELVLIEGSGHNETYDVGGKAYRDKLWGFVRTTGVVSGK
ncbi:MAG: alpha/beta hydrolase [Gemmatimonadetes bacterium]|nr:alpha/beta hydrolase [Gemmatimonadota bacterium]